MALTHKMEDGKLVEFDFDMHLTEDAEKALHAFSQRLDNTKLDMQIACKLGKNGKTALLTNYPHTLNFIPPSHIT